METRPGHLLSQITHTILPCIRHTFNSRTMRPPPTEAGLVVCMVCACISYVLLCLCVCVYDTMMPASAHLVACLLTTVFPHPLACNRKMVQKHSKHKQLPLNLTHPPPPQPSIPPRGCHVGRGQTDWPLSSLRTIVGRGVCFASYVSSAVLCYALLSSTRSILTHLSTPVHPGFDHKTTCIYNIAEACSPKTKKGNDIILPSFEVSAVKIHLFDLTGPCLTAEDNPDVE